MAKRPPEPQEPESDGLDPAESAQPRMSFGEHLEELRSRITKALFGAAVPIFGCVICYHYMLDIISRPYRLVAQMHGLPDVLLANKPQEAFLTSITIAFQAGLVLASPWIIYQIWQFVAAGLYERERKIVYRYTAPSAFLFLIGVSFFYFIVLPMTLHFFMSFASQTGGPPPTPNFIERHLLGIGVEPTTAPATATAPASRPAPLVVPLLSEPPPPPDAFHANLYLDASDHRIKAQTKDHIFNLMVSDESSLFATTWRFDDYISFVTFTALVFGLAFELPMVILVLAQVGIVEVQSFRNVRKYAYFGIIIASALAAPSGDLMTLAFLSVPLVGLYELGIVAAAIAVRRQEKAASE